MFAAYRINNSFQAYFFQHISVLHAIFYMFSSTCATVLTGKMSAIDTMATVTAPSTAHHAQMILFQTPSSAPCTDEILHLLCYIHTHRTYLSAKNSSATQSRSTIQHNITLLSSLHKCNKQNSVVLQLYCNCADFTCTKKSISLNLNFVQTKLTYFAFPSQQNYLILYSSW